MMAEKSPIPRESTNGFEPPQSNIQPRQRRWWQLGGEDVSYVSIDASYFPEAKSSHHNSSDYEANPESSNSVFDTPEVAEIYKPIENFEGRHRFDPSAKWTAEEEHSLVRELDWRIALPLCAMFFALQLDRGNIAQALSDNMLDDLGLNTNDYNNGMTIFYCSFLFAELPSQLVSKKVGPDIWIPIQMVAWSIVAAAQAALTNRASFFACRFLLGILEGGFIPDAILYLSYFYKSSELPKRLAWFWTAYQATQIVGAFLAYGILHLAGKNGIEGWRYLYLIEGSLTCLMGILTWLYLPASPTETSRQGFKGLLRPKDGWFNEREETIMVTRILCDDPGKATMHNRQGLSWTLFKEAILDYDLWPIYILGFSWQIPNAPPAAYITLTLESLGYTTFQTNLLTIPAYVIFILQLLFWTWVSEKINQRLLLGVITGLWTLPLLVALIALPPVFPNSNWAKWAISTLLVGYPFIHAILVGLVSRNAGTVRTRTVGSSVYNMTCQVSSIISTQIYRNNDKPYYYRGNKALLGIVIFNILAFILAKAYYVVKNRRRDQLWNSMTREERLQYLSTTSDKGNKRLDFRFAS